MSKRIACYFVVFYSFVNLLFASANASESKLGPEIEKLNWNGLDVVWLKENRFPTYEIIFYFADGALSDGPNEYGTTNAMFSMLDAGTRRYSRKQISENLEFYGVTFSKRVTHEYSTFSISGLVKDIVPSIKKICHLFQDATYPEKELRKEKLRAQNNLRGIIANPGTLASRIFREVSLKESPYSYPVGGKLSDIRKIRRKKLLKKLEYFNKKVAKRIYISGPRDVTNIKETLTNECGWSYGPNLFTRNVNYSLPPKKNEKKSPLIYLAPIPKSNQAQVIIGRFLDKSEIKEDELMTTSASFLGGGFTSKLMRAVRVREGLTYSIGAVASGQKDYGRVMISTFTKSNTVGKLLAVVKKTLEGVYNGQFDVKDLEHSKSHLIGSHPFSFEDNKSFLSNLLFFDHVGRDYSEIYKFQDLVSKMNKEDIMRKSKEMFNWDDQVIFVLGDQSLKKQLSEFGKVKILKYKKYL
jgi:zinc protease